MKNCNSSSCRFLVSVWRCHRLLFLSCALAFSFESIAGQCWGQTLSRSLGPTPPKRDRLIYLRRPKKNNPQSAKAQPATGSKLSSPPRDFNTLPASFEADAQTKTSRYDDILAAAESEAWEINVNTGSQVIFENDQPANEGFTSRVGFTVHEGQLENHGVACEGIPIPLNHSLQPDQRPAKIKLPQRSEEYIYDGSDRNQRVQVDADWNIYGLDTEDTFGHFDTVDGKRLVSPSNRVAIYAPRFAAVRRIDNLRRADRTTQLIKLERKEGPTLSRGTDFSSSTKQHIAIKTNESSEKAVGFKDRTRGVYTDNVLHLRGARDSVAAYENLDLIKWGKHSSSQTARLKAGMQAALAWQDNLGVQAFINRNQPVVVNDALSVQQTILVETEDENAILKVTKIANKAAARPGEEVEFTIRFDNISGRRIGNVTLVDNLTGRLQYIADTADCSLEGKFITRDNGDGSMLLRWEIEDPLAAGKGGVIRFRCRVR